MTPEKEQLIDDLLPGDEQDARREATLRAGSRVLRRRRFVRAAMPGAALLVVAAFAVFWIQERRGNEAETTSGIQPAATVQVRALTDDELLALFPDTPVGLATLPDGRKRLIFPRPGDEERFVTRL